MDTTGLKCNLAIKEAIAEAERLINEGQEDVLTSLFNLCEDLGTTHNRCHFKNQIYLICLWAMWAGEGKFNQNSGTKIYIRIIVFTTFMNCFRY